MPPVGKSGPLTHFSSVFDFASRLVDQMQRGVAELGGVVRRDRGRHADRDALRAVGEQVRKAAGQHDRLFRLAVVIGAEFDAVLVDAVEQQPRDFGHARFGVAVGGRIIAVDIAEIALPVDQRIARGKILREPHHRVVDRLVAMRMERAHHVADDLGGFLERRAGIEPQQPHAVEDAAMHRLQAVARIRQRAVHDGRERVGEIALFQRLAQLNLVNFRRFRRNQSFSHGDGLNFWGESGKTRIGAPGSARRLKLWTGTKPDSSPDYYTIGWIAHENQLPKDDKNPAGGCASPAQCLSARGRALPGDQRQLRRCRAAGAQARAGIVPAAKRSRFCVACLCGREPAAVCVVSYAISTSIGGLVAKLDDVYVSPHLHGRGVGTQMMKSLKKELRRKRVRRIDTSVHNGNDVAANYYRKNGFMMLEKSG